MPRQRGRLKEPLVRENGTLRPASWDEALDVAAAGLDRARQADTTRSFGMFSCSKASNEANFLGAEVRAFRDGVEQHRLLQPHLTRSQRRRSGDGVRCGRRNDVLYGSGTDGSADPLGVERARDAPDLLPSRPQGGPPGRPVVRGRSTALQQRAVGRHLAGARRRHRHRARQHDRPRDHPRRPGQRDVRRARHDRLRGVQGLGRAVDARGGRAGDRSTGRDDPRAGPRLRARRTGGPVLDARHHRARDRGRQCAVADQPGPDDRARGPLGLGPESAARPEQRPGRRRHGRNSQQAPGLPGHREGR